MFSQNTPQNTKHLLYTFCISGEFCILLMPQKNKPRNPLSFCAKCYEMRKVKKRGAKLEKSDTKYDAIHFSFFAFCDHFRIFRDKCIACLAVQTTQLGNKN